MLCADCYKRPVGVDVDSDGSDDRSTAAVEQSPPADLSSVRDQSAETFERGWKTMNLLIAVGALAWKLQFSSGTRSDPRLLLVVAACCLLPFGATLLGDCYCPLYERLYPTHDFPGSAAWSTILDAGLVVGKWVMRLSKPAPVAGLLVFAWWLARSFGVL